MKQKQVKASPKVGKQPKVTKRAPVSKRVREVVEESDDEEEIVAKKVVAKKPVNKKATKVKKIVVEEPSEDEEQEAEEQDDEEEIVEKKVLVAKKPVNKKATKVKKIVEEPSEDDEQEAEEQDDEEEIVEKKVVAKKPVNKKAAKVKKIVAEPSDDEDDEQEAEEEEDDQDGEEQEEENEDASEEGNENEGHELDEDEEENESDEEDEAEAEDDGDEAPSEEDIEKENPTIPSKVKSGPIPPTVPSNRIIYISKLSKKCKQIDLVEAFAKYGAIDQIHIITSISGSDASIAYKTEKAALAAYADTKGKQIKVNDVLVWVNMKKEKEKKNQNDYRDRSVHIKFLKTGTTEEALRKHFESCGTIVSVKLVAKHPVTYGFVTFTDKSAVPAALKLHNSVLNGSNIKVVNNEKQTKSIKPLDERFLLLVKNKQNFMSVDPGKLEAIFSKCGEIDYMDVVCKKNVLAFVRFKSEKGLEKALQLNGKTEEGIELEVETYNITKRWTTIHVSNLPRDCTEKDLTNTFSKAGEIESIILKNGYAIIRFTDCDGYCKSFLYNESFINGQIIFVEPYSIRKQIVLKSKPFQNKSFKRPAQNGHSVFKPKKFKTR